MNHLSVELRTFQVTIVNPRSCHRTVLLQMFLQGVNCVLQIVQTNYSSNIPRYTKSINPESVPFRERTRAKNHLILDANTGISVDWAPKRVGVVVRGTAACLPKRRGRNPTGAKSKTVNLAIKNRTHFGARAPENPRANNRRGRVRTSVPRGSPGILFRPGLFARVRAVNEHFPESIFFDNSAFLVCLTCIFFQSAIICSGSRKLIEKCNEITTFYMKIPRNFSSEYFTKQFALLIIHLFGCVV